VSDTGVETWTEGQEAFKQQTPEDPTYSANSDLKAHYGCSRSFKIIKTGTNGKPICDFLLVVTSKLDHIVYHF